jgi:nitrate reductase NapE component
MRWSERRRANWFSFAILQIGLWTALVVIAHKLL